jgi:hypothetical protein
MSKVIHVSSSIDSVGKYLVLCVCDDGTIWKLHGLYEGKPGWEAFPLPDSDGIVTEGVSMRIRALSRALKDCISLFDEADKAPDHKSLICTEDRREMWLEVLKKYGVKV